MQKYPASVQRRKGAISYIVFSLLQIRLELCLSFELGNPHFWTDISMHKHGKRATAEELNRAYNQLFSLFILHL